MADTTSTNIGSKITYFLTHYSIYLGATIILLIVVIGVKNFFFPKKDTQVNKPISWVAPFGKVGKLDQSNTQIDLSEKPWEVGVGVAGLRYDNKDGAIVGGWIKRKW